MHEIDKSLAMVLYRKGLTIYLNPKEQKDNFKFCSGINPSLSGNFEEATEIFKNHSCIISRSLNYYIKDNEKSIK